jgi:hypothetical protein
MFNTLNEWFQTTNMWYEDIQFTGVVNDASYIYVIEPSQPSAIVRLIGVVDNNQRTVAAVMDTLGQLQLVISPTEAVVYTARVALTINDPLDRENYPNAPDWVLNKYMNDLVDGVVGRLMMQVGKPYSNSQMGIWRTREFNKGVAMARVEAQRHNVWRQQNWVFPQSFFRKKQQNSAGFKG